MTTTIMGRDELARHKIGSHGRDYSRSCDGYDDMEVATAQKWNVLSAWGRDGWDLGEWPYVAISIRTLNGKFQMQQVVEGDHDLYEFATEAERTAAIDYLFLWYSAGKSWAPLTREDRARLDAGEIVVDEKYRGAFSWARCYAEPKQVEKSVMELER